MKNTAIKIFLFPLVVITSIQTMDIDVAPETQLQRALSISDAEDQINALRATVAEGENIQRTNDFMADEYHTPYSLDILQRARYELARRTNIWNNHNELNQAAFNTVSSLYDAILHNAGASNPNDIATEVQRDRFSIAVKISSSDPERALTILQSIDHNPFHLNHLETLNIACMIAENVDTQDRITRLRNLIPLIRVMVQRGTHYNIESMSDFRPASALLQDSCFDLGDLLINSADGDVASFYEGIKMLEECADLDTDEHIDELIFLRASRSLPPLLLDCVLYDPNFLAKTSKE